MDAGKAADSGDVVRFSLFVHMERWDDQVSHRQLFENLTELTLMAEAGGFSTVWIGEHHSMEYTISPSPMPLLAYLAGQTSPSGWAPAPSSPRSGTRSAAGERALLDVTAGWKSDLARGATSSSSTGCRRAAGLRGRQVPARAGAGYA